MTQTFSFNVKQELCAKDIASMEDYLRVAELYGAFLLAQSFSFNKIKLFTTNTRVAARMKTLLKAAFKLSFDSVPTQGGMLIIDSPEKLSKIFYSFGHNPKQSGTSIHINNGLLDNEGCLNAFLRGAFLSGGSITDPLKKYHLEIVTPHHHLIGELTAVLHECGFEPKVTSRSGVNALYFQSSEMIEDILSFIGAPSSALRLMETKIEKDLRNNINRRVNCDSGNLIRTVIASEAQQEHISKLMQSREWERLPEQLKITGIARLASPESSLAELAEQLEISKSALNHRLRKLNAMALGINS